MTDKAYIVVNEEQEREVLEKLERLGAKWRSGGMPTERSYLMKDTITIFVGDDNQLTFDDEVNEGDLADCEIVFDGRKEEQMSDKYVVSQEFMDELEEWKSELSTNGKCYIFEEDIYELPSVVETWWKECMEKSDEETNNRLIAILRWVNGEDVFEVEKPKKWVVRSKGLTNDDEHYYVSIGEFLGLKRVINTFDLENATKFDTKEEAESWANSHQEVVEVKA